MYTGEIDELYKVNSVLWDVENEIRLCEAQHDFGPNFVRLARLVYHMNDRRARIKREINKDCPMAEEKQYTEYTKDTKETLGILTHMGLGDHLVCNGLVRHFIKTYNVVLYVKHHNVASVEYMFRDTDITIVPVNDDQDALTKRHKNTLRTGIFYGPLWNSQPPWCDSFYRNVGLDPTKMMTDFFVLRSRDKEESMYKRVIDHLGTDQYIVIHDDPERYTCISVNTSLPIVRIGRGQFPVESTNIFDYSTLIERAAEYHGFDSSFLWLVKLMKLRSKETTFLHRIRPATNPGYEEFEMTSNGTPP